jgi:hypothetical protein
VPPIMSLGGGGSFSSLETGAGLWVAFACVCCHHVPAVSLAELLTAGMFVWKLLQQTGLNMCWVVFVAVSLSWLLPLFEGWKADIHRDPQR